MKYREIVLFSLAFMVSLTMNLMNRLYDKCERKGYSEST